MFVQWSLGLQNQKLHNRNPFAFSLEIRPSERAYVDLDTRLGNEGSYAPNGKLLSKPYGTRSGKDAQRNGGGQNAHTSITLWLDGIGGTFKTAANQNRGNQSRRKRVWL